MSGFPPPRIVKWNPINHSKCDSKKCLMVIHHFDYFLFIHNQTSS